jgi:hypothetical protein
MMQDVHVKLNPGLPWQNQHLTERRLFTSKLDLTLRKKLAKCYTCSAAMYVAETWASLKVDQKYLRGFEMWCWRRMEKTSWVGCVRNEEVLHRVKDKNILHRIKRNKAKWIGNMLRRNRLLKHIIEETRNYG